MAQQTSLLHEWDASVRYVMLDDDGKTTLFDTDVKGTMMSPDLESVEQGVEEMIESQDGEILHLKLIQHRADGTTLTRHCTYGEPGRYKPTVRLPVTKPEPKEASDWYWLGDCPALTAVKDTHVVAEPCTYKAQEG